MGKENDWEKGKRDWNCKRWKIKFWEWSGKGNDGEGRGNWKENGDGNLRREEEGYGCCRLKEE